MRSALKKRVLLVRRIITNVLSVIFIILGWCVIVSASLYEKNIANYFTFLPKAVVRLIYCCTFVRQV